MAMEGGRGRERESACVIYIYTYIYLYQFEVYVYVVSDMNSTVHQLAYTFSEWLFASFLLPCEESSQGFN
jgi:hypothetical protein